MLTNSVRKGEKMKYNKADAITRCYQTEFRAGEEEGVIMGTPIVLEQETDLGYYTEIIDRNALNNTDFKDVFLFVNHDINKIPLARSRNNTGSSTMHLQVDNEGLQMRATLDVKNNSEASSLYSAITRGDMDGMSFMFYVDKDEWSDLDTDKPKRRILSIPKVFEVSAVNYPAYPQTSLSARDINALDNAKKALDSAKRSMDIDRLQLEKLKNKNRTY
jgi:HK97 family phage prohead protease